MPLDPRFRRLLDMVAASGPSAAATIDERRRGFAKLMALGGAGPVMARIEDRTVPGPDGAIPIRLYMPAERAGDLSPGLVFFHGGGFVAGGLDTHDALARMLAEATGARIAAVGYRLAPEHKFPAGLSDCLAATRWAMDHAAELGLDAGRIAVAGNSAGGTLAAIVCRMLAEEGGPQPLFHLLLCPIADFAADTESRRLYGSGYLIDAATIAADLAWYLPPGTMAADPRVSPLRAVELRGVCPAYIHAAEADPLRDEAEAYAHRLRRAGIAARYTCHPGMIHLFYALPGIVPAARTAWATIGVEIRAAFAAASVPAKRAAAG